MEERINELERKVEKLEDALNSYNENNNEKMTQILSSVTRIEEKLEGRKIENEAKSALADEKINGIKTRVTKLEDSQSWIVRAIVGEVIGLIMVAVTALIKRGI